MKSSISKIVEIALALGILALVVILVVPSREAPLTPPPSGAKAETTQADASTKSAPKAADIATVLLLFGVTGQSRPAPVTPAPTPTSAKPPVDAPWLNYIGYATQADGKPYYMIKDTRSNRMIKVAEGAPMGGWSLVEASATRLVLSNNTDTYIVKKR